MMPERALQDVMKDVARQLDRAHAPAPVIEDEGGAYESLDPLLADLRKQRLDAAAHYDTLVRENGAADPMTDIARDMMESAESAYETRLIELCADRALRRKARKICQAAAVRESENKLSSLRYRDKLTKFYDKTRRDRNKKDLEKRGADMFFTSMILLWFLFHTIRMANRNFELAQVFLAASHPDAAIKAA